MTTRVNPHSLQPRGAHTSTLSLRRPVSQSVPALLTRPPPGGDSTPLHGPRQTTPSSDPTERVPRTDPTPLLPGSLARAGPAPPRAQAQPSASVRALTLDDELCEVGDARAARGLGHAAVEVLLRAAHGSQREGGQEATVADVPHAGRRHQRPALPLLEERGDRVRDAGGRGSRSRSEPGE